jgi:glycosyltransferase involved in cell wall biosynthesis
MASKNITISIILPAYNSERYIGEAIQSVIDQSFQDWELIVINDGSSDQTSLVVSEFNDPRIILIEQANSGVSFSRNIGLLIAKGEFITFIDADDTFPHNSLELRVNYLKKNKDIHIVGGALRIMNAELNAVTSSKNPNYCGPFLPKLLALDVQIYSGICYLARQCILKSEKFDEEMTHCEDLLFWIKVSVNNKAMYGSVDDYIYNYRVHGASATHADYAWRKGYIELIKRIDMIENLPYLATLSMRFKISFMLMKWHFKRKTFKDIFKIFEILI